MPGPDGTERHRGDLASLPMADEDFQRALRAAIEVDPRSQRALAEAVTAEEGRERPWHQTSVNAWASGKDGPPKPATVCALERVLDLAPGALTLHLGYLPPYARGEVLTVPAAIDADPQLTAKERAALKAAYAAFVSPADGSTVAASSSSRNG